jgi:hypothetical protein
VLIENEKRSLGSGNVRDGPSEKRPFDGRVMALLDKILGSFFPGQSVPPLTITLVALEGRAGALSPTP